jgi:hypothetical protein
VKRALSHWQKHSDLAGIRDKAALEKIPANDTEGVHSTLGRRGGAAEEGRAEEELTAVRRRESPLVALIAEVGHLRDQGLGRQ